MTQGDRYNPALMGLITRCPGCGTMFKVVPDQLKISEGWVRCGHCSDVFDASAHLQPADAVAAASIDSHQERLAAAESPAEPPEIGADAECGFGSAYFLAAF